MTLKRHFLIGFCNSNEFICKSPPNTCIDSNFVCDQIESCADSSDEQNCIHLNATTENSSTTNIATVPNSIDNIPPHGNSHLDFFIGFLIILSIATALLFGLWIYGRRKRKWREFLAQLDNNTDWEYQQLDDNPLSIGTSSNMPTMLPIFNMSSTNTTIENNNQSNNKRESTERTPIA